MKSITFILALLLFASGIAHGQAGYLDKTFGNGGAVTIQIDNRNIAPRDIEILPDGRILHAGWMDGDIFPNTYIYILIHKEDGSIDSSFGKFGYAIFSGVFTIGEVNVSLYQNGKILVYGDMSKDGPLYMSQPFAIRFLADGRIDSSFGNSGLYFEDGFHSRSYFRKVKIHDDGTLTAVGVINLNSDLSYRPRPTITKITSDGRRDTSFGDQGIVLIGDSSYIGDVAGQSFTRDGQTIIAFAHPQSLQSGLHMIKCDLNGALDSTFGENGEVRMQLSDGEDAIYSIIETSDGNIVCLVGAKILSKQQSLLLRFKNDGVLDKSFGDDGITGSIDSKGSSYFLCYIDSNNNIIMAGHIYEGCVTRRFSTTRYLSDGVKDSSYGKLGVSYECSEQLDPGGQMAIQRDGKYVAVGNYLSPDGNYIGALFRLNNIATSSVSGSILPKPSISLHPTPSAENCTVTYTLPTSGECIMALRDESGKKVRVFAQNEYRTVGEHKEELDLRGLASGVYFLQVESNGSIQTAKLIKQ